MFVPPYHYAGNLRSIQSRPPVDAPKRADDSLGKLEALADAKELQLARTHSVRAIENLQAMYGYYVDKGQWKSAAALFAAKGTYEFGQSGVYVGNAHVERGLSLMGPQGLEEGQLNNYVTVQPIIHISADNRTAKARWRSDVQLSRAGVGRWGGGVYENEYVNEKGTWKFSKLHYYVTFWGDYDAGLGRQAHSDGCAQHHQSAGPATHRGVCVLPEAAGGAVSLRTPCHQQAARGGIRQCSTTRENTSPCWPCCALPLPMRQSVTRT